MLPVAITVHQDDRHGPIARVVRALQFVAHRGLVERTDDIPVGADALVRLDDPLGDLPAGGGRAQSVVQGDGVPGLRQTRRQTQLVPLQAQAQSWVAENKGKVVTKVKTSRNQVIKGSEKNEMPFEFPAQAVEPGFSWTQPGKLFGPGSSVTYKLTKIGTYAGKAAAFLSLTPSNSKARIVSPLIFILDLSNGWFLKASGAFEVPIQPSVKLTTSLNVTRV